MFRKTAFTEIIEAKMGDTTHSFVKNAHRAVFNYTPKEGMLYVRSRAISSRCNDNFDMFPAEEIEKAYLTFIGKPVFVNHNNEDHRRARGVIIDAALHRDKNPDGSPDTWVELLHEIDAVTFPMLAKAIIAKEVNRTSMGCDVEFSKCSVCHNVATSPQEYCQHIPGKKGKRIVHAGSGSVGQREAKLVFEICSGLSFFENSLLVEPPADPTAFFLGDVEYGPGLESMASMAKTASADNEWDAHREFSERHPSAHMDPDEEAHFHQFNMHQDGPGPRPVYRNFEHLFEHHGDDYGDLDDLGTREYRAHRDHYDREPEKSYAPFHPKDWSTISDRRDAPEDRGHPDERVYDKFLPHPSYSPQFRSMNSLNQREGSWNQKTSSRKSTSSTASTNNNPYHSIWNLIKMAADAEEHENAAAQGVANDHVRSFQDREVPDHGDRVAVYRDLSGAPKSGYPARGSWSIKRLSDKGGKSAHVYAHTVGLHITNAEPTFDEGARQHFKEQEKRGVHAYIGGNVHHYAHPLEPGQKPEGEGWRQVSYYPDISHFFMKDTRNKYHGSDEAAFRGGSMWARGNIKEGSDGPVPLSRFEQPKTGSIWNFIYEADLSGDDLEEIDAWSHVAKLNDDRPYETLTPDKKITEMSDEEKAAHKSAVKAHAEAWMKRNPMNAQNIVDHWNHATPEEKENGENWYQDAHHTSKLIAHATGTPEHAMAGLVSNYSPQTHWATNIVTAAKAARLKIGLGGKGNKHGEPVNGVPKGIMASEGQRAVGHALVNAPHDEQEALATGQHYEHLLKGPKTKAFARLIHNGGDDHSVVVDRHAFSVASGARASDAAYGFSGLGGKKRYAEAEGHYRQAAQQISQQEGRTIHPHQVQAATWLVRQRLNEEGDRELLKKGARSASAARTAIRQMHHYMGEHHPEASLQMPGTGYSKETGLAKEDLSKSSVLVSGGIYRDGRTGRMVVSYGETKAPQDVDTLRSENCTVCGNSTAFDGVQCQVCGYIAPPRPFGDPDTETARNSDIRKQVLDSADGTADPNDPDQQLGNQIGNPEELDEQDSDAETEGLTPGLSCTNCGTGITPAPAQSEGGEPPYPAEGDVCPVCNRGELLSQQDPGEDADEDGIPDAEETEDPDAEDSDDKDEEDDSDPFAKNSDDESDDDDDKDDNKKKEKK